METRTRFWILLTVCILASPAVVSAQSRNEEAQVEYDAREQEARAQRTIDSLRSHGRNQEAFRLQEQLIQRREARNEARFRRMIFMERRQGNKELADRLENQLQQIRESQLQAAEMRRTAEADRQALADAIRPNTR